MSITASGVLAFSIAIGVLLSMNQNNAAAEVGATSNDQIEIESLPEEETSPTATFQQPANSPLAVPATQEPAGNPKSEATNPDSSPSSTDVVLATVNGIEIKASVVANVVYMQNRERMLEKLIDEKLIEEEVIKTGILPFPPEAVDAEIKRKAEMIGMTTERYLKILMRERGITKTVLANMTGTRYWATQFGLNDPAKFQAKIDSLRENGKIIRVMDDPILASKHPRIAAFVNNNPITLETVRRECVRMLGKKELDSMISLTILTSQANASKHRGLAGGNQR